MKYIYEFYTVNLNVSVDAIKTFVNNTTNSAIDVKKYGSFEPCKESFDLDHVDDILKRIKTGLLLKGVVRGRKTIGSSQIDWNNGITRWWFQVDLKKEIDKNLLQILYGVMTSMNEVNPVLYGFLCSEAEYDRLHKDVVYFDDGGTKESWKGGSSADFSECLPGIYWFNFFGKELVNAFGMEKLNTIADVEYLGLAENCVAFHLKEPIDAKDLNLRSGRLFKINQHIGSSYFYNLVNEEEMNFAHPQSFKNYLGAVESSFKKGKL